MKYMGMPININNYSTVFKDCTPDVLDEIRLAVLDNTDIMIYINDCGDDSYKLGQIRLSLREGVPYRFINTSITAKSIKCIRYCYKHSISLDPLIKYYLGSRILLRPEVFEIVVETLSLGGNISKVDFLTVPDSILEIICRGLVRGYPMWLFVNDKFTESYIRLLMRGLDLGIDISPFIKDVWGESQLVLLFANVEKIDINSFLSYVNNKFSYEALKILIKAVRDGISIDRITYRDRDGYPVYSHYQMEVLVKALKMIKQGLNCDDVFNPKLSDKEMSDKLDFILEELNQ